MNRTRKIVAAGIGTAVILAIVVMMLLSPPLHTQTPVSASPPSNGGTGNGANGGNNTGSGPGAGNNTAGSCNQTSDDHEWDDRNETDGNWTGNHTWDDNSQTSDTAVHSLDDCNATAGDHDGMGDQESEMHASPHADLGDADMLSADALSFAMGVSSWISSFAPALVSSVGLTVGSLTGFAVAGPILW